jgi:hypothetical protein
MAESSKDIGVMLALIERFETQRLPRAQALKAKVDRSDVLSDQDLAYLNQVLEDAQHIKTLVHKHPEWQPLVARGGAVQADHGAAWRTSRPGDKKP